MSESKNKEIAECFLSSYATRDFNTLATLLHDEIEWTLPGRGLISGTAKGVDAVIDRIQTIIKNGTKTELKHVLIGQNGIALFLHNTGSKSEHIQLDEHLATVLTIESSLVIKIDTFLSDVPMMESFFV